MSARGLPKLTPNLWEVGDGPDPERVGYYDLAATAEDVARDRWGSGVQLGPNRAGVRAATGAVLPEDYPATASGATIDFTARPVVAAA